MASALSRLGAWARALRVDQVPPDVLRLARLQHLAGAGALRRARATTWARGLQATDPTARDAELLAHFGYDDHLLAARTGVGLLPAAWARAEGAPVDELLLATVVGDELGGRVGLATLHGPRATGVALAGPLAAAAATRARLEGEDIAAAVAGALESLGTPPPVHETAPGWLGAEVARRVARRARGSVDLLDPAGDWWAAIGTRPLPGALAGEGRAWLTRTLVLHRFAAPPWFQVVLSAVDEILRRHLRAAEKRLRADQVERLDARLTLPAWAFARATAARPDLDLPTLLGVLVSHHALTPTTLDDSTRAGDVAHVAGTVGLTPDWGLTLRAAHDLARGLSPLLGRPSWLDYQALRRPTKAAGAWPAWGPSDLRDLGRANPVQALRPFLTPRGDLGAVDLDHFAWSLPVEVKLYTTRGGWWPERRGRPAGAGDEAEAVAVEKWGDPTTAAELLAAGGSGADWVRALTG